MKAKTRQTILKNIKKSSKSGFSMVDIMCMLLIISILVVILAPSLIGYVERMRTQKDISSMDSVLDAVFLAMASPSVYDEVLFVSMLENVSCYIDADTETETNMVITHGSIGSDEHAQYTYGDEARICDGVEFYAAGNMRGITITFQPTTSFGKAKYVLTDCVINRFFVSKAIGICGLPKLYNHVRSVVGNEIELKSQTYRNSEYTVFVSIGSTGGGQSSAQQAVKVHGQFSGTNLSTATSVYYVAYGRNVCDPNAGVRPRPTTPIQPGDEYGEDTLDPDDGTTPQLGDIYIRGEYEYCYGYSWCVSCRRWSSPSPDGCGCAERDEKLKCDGWAVRVIDETKEAIGSILKSINGEPVIVVREW